MMQEIMFDPPITLEPGAYMGAVFEGRVEYWRDGRVIAAYERCPDGIYRPDALTTDGTHVDS